jgi:hypothetical protein
MSRGRPAKRVRRTRTRAIPGFNSRRVIRTAKPSLNVHRFSRFSTAADITCNGTTATGQFQFKFDDILGHTEFGAMFDSFKISS